MITQQYTYNGDGQRVRIVDGDSPTGRDVVWDDENVLLESNTATMTGLLLVF
jgi:hypothetical protein